MRPHQWPDGGCTMLRSMLLQPVKNLFWECRRGPWVCMTFDQVVLGSTVQQHCVLQRGMTPAWLLHSSGHCQYAKPAGWLSLRQCGVALQQTGCTSWNCSVLPGRVRQVGHSKSCVWSRQRWWFEVCQTVLHLVWGAGQS